MSEKKSTNVLFIGGIFPKELEREIINNSNNTVQLAANNFQWNLIDSFDYYLDRPITIINEMFLGSYPKNYSKPYIKKNYFSHTTGAKDVNLGFINVAYLKHLIHPFDEKKEINFWIKKTGGKKAVFIYSLDIRFIRIAKFIKSIDPSIPIIVSVMDLPEHIMKAREHSVLVKLWKKYLVKVVYNGLGNVDGCMLVANNQLERIPKDYNDCVLVESIVNSTDREFYPIENDREKHIVYAGTLAKHYNIMDLVNAVMRIDNPNVVLDICGEGDCKEAIMDCSLKDKRIKYHGLLSKGEVEKLMRNAWLLVNPRKRGQDFTNYSFPSKTLDYLFSGRPVICQKLEAIPQEYDDYLLYFDSDDNYADLIAKINTVINFDINEANVVGKKNFEFVAKKKCADIQIEKIMGLFEYERSKLLKSDSSTEV